MTRASPAATVGVFVDGHAGTTGLEIADRLAHHPGVTLLTLPDAARRSLDARAAMARDADVTILCLPDEAARELVAALGPDDARLIDASSAHRVAPGWTYGLPELAPGQRGAIAAARRVSNPGCYPTGFLAMIAPLRRAGLVDRDALLSVHAVSGVSGGGKALIAHYAEAGAAAPAWRAYALGFDHKHLGEMRHHADLATAPIFAPAVVPAHRGMAVTVALHRPDGDAGAVTAAIAAHHAASALVSVRTGEPDALEIAADAAGDDRLTIHAIAAPDGRAVRLVALFDNLGKGAAGAAVQSLNLMTGWPETTALRL